MQFVLPWLESFMIFFFPLFSILCRYCGFSFCSVVVIEVVISCQFVLQIIRERRWKEVTAVFNFPSTATNASFVLRKYYSSLLYHYEQIYYFKASRWTPAASGL